MEQAFENSQGSHYELEYDYWSESPHLKHRHLHETLMTKVSDLVREKFRDDRPVEVLEVGAGDGAVSERLLALGCDVTATEMSTSSVATLNDRYSSNLQFRAVFDSDGSLEAIGDRSFDLVVFASVLHHIPDYLATIRSSISNHLRQGGMFASIQDPLWYPRMSTSSLRLTRFCYITWRLTQGNLIRGLKTRVHRARFGLSEEAPGDVIEYHVVRSGVDELAIGDFLEAGFDEVQISRYWSSQGSPQQWIGERLGLVNTFAAFGRGYHPPGGTPSSS